MSRASAQPASKDDWSIDEVDHLYLDHVSWELYEHLLRESGHRRLRMTYDNGELEIISPLWEHETPSRILCYFITILAEETNVPLIGGGSTTFRWRGKKKGLEPDECFYIKSQPLIRGKKRISIPKDPPPDLVVEVDITRRSIPRLPIYATLGVPEIWRHDGKRVQCLQLTKAGDYREVDNSLSFPMLKPADLARFIRQAETTDLVAAGKAFRKWVRKHAWAKPS
jgi:Uma2 family endonuclease